MPTKYRPTYRLEVLYNDEDWEDITGFVDTWTIEYGSDLSLDRYGIPVTTASGTITLDNNGLYDPDSENKKFTSEQLVRRNEFRLWADEIIEFQGFVTAPDVITSEVDPIISYTVESRHKPTLQFNSNELNTEPTTMAGLARSFTEVTGIPLNSSSDQPVGNVFFRGRWLDFLDDYARYGGGFVLEDNRGSFNYRNYREAVEFAETAGLGFDYEPFAEDFHTRKTSEQVLNHVECSGFGYLNPVTEVVARATLPFGTGEIRNVTLRFNATRDKRLASWTFATVSNSAFTINSQSANPDGTYTVVVEAPAFSNPRDVQDITITATGQTQQRFEQQRRVLDVIDFDSQQIYGVNEIDLPSWFPVNFNGLYRYTRSWIRLLAIPPVLSRVTYSEWQPTAGRSYVVIESLQPGNRVLLTTSAGQLNMLILKVRLSGGDSIEPTRTVFGIDVKAVPDPALIAEVSDFGETYASIRMVPPSIETKDLYLRFKQRSHSWDPERFITIPVISDEMYYNISGLEDDTEYDVQVDIVDTFTSTNRVDLEFTTELTRNLLLSQVLINGVPITGWNFATQNSFTTTVTFSTRSGTVNVSAAPLQSAATVTVIPPSREGGHEDVLTYGIRLVNGPITKLYDLTVNVVSTFIGDNNSLSAAGNNIPNGIWSDDDDMFVFDRSDDLIYRYDLNLADYKSEFSIAGTHAGEDITGDGNNIYFTRQERDLLTFDLEWWVWRIPKSGGTATKLFKIVDGSISGNETPVGIVYYNNRLYIIFNSRRLGDEKYIISYNTNGSSRVERTIDNTNIGTPLKFWHTKDGTNFFGVRSTRSSSKVWRMNNSGITEVATLPSFISGDAGIWGNDERWWLADASDDKLYVFDLDWNYVGGS